MTETTRRRPAGSGTTGRSRSAARAEPRQTAPSPDEAVATPAGAAVEPPELRAKPGTTTPPRKAAALEESATPPAHRSAGLGLTIHVPFVTVTVGPQPIPPGPAGGSTGRGTVERLAFYGGVATLGAVGVLEWPVAAAIAAGTWVAQHTLPRPAG